MAPDYLLDGTLRFHCEKCVNAGRECAGNYTGDGKDYVEASRQISKDKYVTLECETIVDQTPNGQDIPGTKKARYICNHRHSWRVVVG